MMKPASPEAWLLQLVTKPAAKPAQPTAMSNPPKSKRDLAYGKAALDGELRRVLSAALHQRNNTLHLSSFKSGQLIAAGCLDEMEVVRRLTQAATEIGLEAS